MGVGSIHTKYHENLADDAPGSEDDEAITDLLRAWTMRSDLPWSTHSLMARGLVIDLWVFFPAAATARCTLREPIGYESKLGWRYPLSC